MTTLTDSFQDLLEPLATEASESLWFSLNNELWWPDFSAKLAKAFVTLQRGEISKADLDFTDDANAFAEQYALKHGGELITNITADQQKAIQLITSQAFTHGVSDQVIAKRIQKTLGLTDADATVLNSFRQGLLHRGVPAGSADYQSEQYGDKLRWARAVLIARTEIAKAMNAGQLEAWETGLVTGDLDPETQRRWVLSRLNRHCMKCVGMAGTSIPIAKSYPGNIIHPPLHPNCGCTEELVTPTGFSKFYALDVRVRISKGRKAEDVEEELRRAAGSGIIGRYHPGEWTENSLPDRDPNLHLIRRHKVHDRPGTVQHLIAVNNHHYYLKKESYGLWQAIEYDKNGKADIIVRAKPARGRTVSARTLPIRRALDTWIGQNPTKYSDRVPPPGGWPKVREAESSGQYAQELEDIGFVDKNPEKIKEEPFRMNPREPVPWSWYWRIKSYDDDGKPVKEKIITSYRPGDYRMKQLFDSRKATRERNRLHRASVRERASDAEKWNKAVNLDQDKEAFNAALKQDPVPDEEVQEASPLTHIKFFDSKDRYPGWEVWQSVYDPKEKYYVKKLKRSTENGVDVYWGAFYKPEDTKANYIDASVTHEELLRKLDNFVGPGLTPEEKKAVQEARRVTVRLPGAAAATAVQNNTVPLANDEEALTEAEIEAQRAAKISRRHETKAQRIAREAAEVLENRRKAEAHAHEMAEESRVRVLRTQHGLGDTDTSARSITGRPPGYKPRVKKPPGEQAAAALNRRQKKVEGPLPQGRVATMDLVSGGTIKPTPLPPPEPKSANVFSGLKKTDKARPGTRKLSDANRKWIVDDATTGKGHWAALDPATGKMEAQRVIEGKYGRLSLSGAYHDLHVLNNAQALLDQHWKPGMPYELAHGWGGIHDSDMPFYHPEYRVYEAKQKHIKVKDFITNVLPHLDAALQADYLKSDAAAIALLMRKTSLRSGSTPMGSGKVETYGAASLRRSHVHMDEVRRPMTATEMLARSPEEVRAGVHHSPDWIPDPGIASIDFVGKKGVHQYFEYDDPMLYKLFQHYLKKNKNYTFTHQRKELDEKGNVAKTTTHKLDRLFANEGVRQRGGRQRDAYGDMVHWFRTRGAAGKTATAPYGHIPYAMRTAAATILAQKVKADLYSDKPTSEREFKNRRKLIAQHVCRLLGNKPTESDKTYIAPEVYADWTKGQSWEIPEDEGVEEVSNAD